VAQALLPAGLRIFSTLASPAMRRQRRRHTYGHHIKLGIPNRSDNHI
jgi:hypothetical protein